MGHEDPLFRYLEDKTLRDHPTPGGATDPSSPVRATPIEETRGSQEEWRRDRVEFSI